MKTRQSLKMILAVLALSTGVFAKAQDDVVITSSQLPKTAQAFIKKNFSSPILQATKDYDYGIISEYQVYLEDGTKLDFNRSGVWKEIENKHMGIPFSAVPAKIAAYIKQKFPSTKVLEIDKKHYGYSVKISNGLELEFSSSGAFLRIDD